MPANLMIEILLIQTSEPVNRKTIKSKRGTRVITTRQVKAARALLGWSQGDLARHSSISEPTIARLETVDGEIRGRPSTATKIKEALEKGGVEFIDENRGGLDLRLRKRLRPKKQK